jgi:hypothetical protein
MKATFSAIRFNTAITLVAAAFASIAATSPLFS